MSYLDTFTRTHTPVSAAETGALWRCSQCAGDCSPGGAPFEVCGCCHAREKATGLPISRELTESAVAELRQIRYPAFSYLDHTLSAGAVLPQAWRESALATVAAIMHEAQS